MSPSLVYTSRLVTNAFMLCNNFTKIPVFPPILRRTLLDHQHTPPNRAIKIAPGTAPDHSHRRQLLVNPTHLVLVLLISRYAAEPLAPSFHYSESLERAVHLSSPYFCISSPRASHPFNDGVYLDPHENGAPRSQ
ncbi:hypothetical protein Hypma_011277 [Hypsizygus marmoreus]|uniref:Uncharacterized protein n=1 Tax=Hypsizygus marmoreus TaxID=39966 RepID=A0A369JSB2_HYPMA|nr:hypothetical protein Hypma_011277 [Hypsizygus marmoreus]